MQLLTLPRASRPAPHGSGVNVSFEFFPPKTEEMEAVLWDAIGRLAQLAPAFVSVTYGAGGSTRERTHDLVVRIQRETNLTAVSHLTCVCHKQDELAAILDRDDDPNDRAALAADIAVSARVEGIALPVR